MGLVGTRAGWRVVGRTRYSTRWAPTRQQKQEKKWTTLLYESIVYNLGVEYKEQAIKNLKKYYNYTDEKINELCISCEKTRQNRIEEKNK